MRSSNPPPPPTPAPPNSAVSLAPSVCVVVMKAVRKRRRERRINDTNRHNRTPRFQGQRDGGCWFHLDGDPASKQTNKQTNINMLTPCSSSSPHCVIISRQSWNTAALISVLQDQNPPGRVQTGRERSWVEVVGPTPPRPPTFRKSV